ncbi:unnamed protein product [Orchesella dallaii]|uniref:Glycoprotein n=1 Tax=Orchesella dallaii TaxID=48710 RepID=A0ABP1RH74_9HEXA
MRSIYGVRMLLLMVIGMCSVATFVHSIELSQNPEAEIDLNFSNDAASFFNDFEEKSDVLWKCDGWYGGVKWRIPKSLDCSMPTTKEENKVVEVTLFLTDINQQSVQGYECYKTKTEGWIHRNFFDAKRSETKLIYIEVSSKECWEMVNNKKSPDGRVLSEKGGIIGTFDKLNIVSYWWHNVSGTVINYAIVPLKIAILELDKSIQTTSILKRPCLYNESTCPTEIGILVWNSNDVKICRLKELQSTTCIYAYGQGSKRLTCPDVELSLHDISHIQLCHHTLGSSSQGIFFAQKDPYEIDGVITTSDVIRSLIKPKRSRRSTQEINAFEAFMNAKLNYLYEVVTNQTSHAINKIHHDVCKANQMNLYLVRYMAETGHPTVVPRYISGDPSYRAALSGDILSVWQCVEIRSYKFLPRETCIREWPVAYIFNNKLLMGYVSPLSHTILSKPTLMPEPCSEFFFDGESNVYQLTNDGAVLTQIPTIPNNGDNQKHFNFPDLSFRSGSGFDISEITDIAHTYSILREVQARALRLDELSVEMTEIRVELTPIRFFWNTAVTILSFLPTFVKYTIGVVAGIITVSLVGLMCVKLSLLIGIANIFISGLKYVHLFLEKVGFKKSTENSDKKKRRNKNKVVSPDIENSTGNMNEDILEYYPSAPSMHEIHNDNSLLSRHARSSNRNYPTLIKH